MSSTNREKAEKAQEGKGIYLLRNKTFGDIMLPKLSLDGIPKRTIGPNAVFHGDSYHIQHLEGMVEVVKVIRTENSEEDNSVPERYDPKTNTLTKCSKSKKQPEVPVDEQSSEPILSKEKTSSIGAKDLVD